MPAPRFHLDRRAEYGRHTSHQWMIDVQPISRYAIQLTPRMPLCACVLRAFLIAIRVASLPKSKQLYPLNVEASGCVGSFTLINTAAEFDNIT